MRHLMVLIYASTVAGAVTAVIRRAPPGESARGRQAKARPAPANDKAAGTGQSFAIGTLLFSKKRAKYRYHE